MIKLAEPRLFEFLQTAMATVILAYTALENYTTELLPDDFHIAAPRGGAELTRDQIEQRGLEFRLSRVMAELMGRPNLMTADPKLWAGVLRLKERREALGHLKAADAYPASSPIPAESIWSDLLSIRSYTRDVVGLVEDVVHHYGFVVATTATSPA